MLLFRVGFLFPLLAFTSALKWIPGIDFNPSIKTKERSFKSENNTLSLWGGRILLAMENKNQAKDKADKNLKLCISSDNEIGVCTRLALCPTFKITKLHNNICFLDVFIPGVCCVLKEEGEEANKDDKNPFKIYSDDSPKDPDEKDSDDTRGPSTDPSSPPDLFEDTFFGSKRCGINWSPTSRIINGERAKAGRWPWMAAIFTNTILGRNFHCGGSLVSTTHVLTGSHCIKDHTGRTIKPKQITVRLGDSDVSTLNDRHQFEHGRFFSVQKIIAHPKFRNINHYFMNDVAVLKLKDKVTFSDYISPICLPSFNAVDEPLDKYEGKMGTVIGFGRTESGKQSKKLLEAQVPIWKNNKCDASYFAPITDIFICAGYEFGGIDACQGDSGGPLQLKVNNRWVQIGITSFGKGCGEPGYPGVYARVGKFVEWISENMI